MHQWQKLLPLPGGKGLDHFIHTLPDGYQMQMGQMGARLSGGERQRVGIARVMLADPDVVVMDAPTSSLNVLHEKELLKTLQEAYSDKTLLIISHRMWTLVGCNRLIRLECGRSGGDEICKRNKRRVGWIKERERFYRSLS